MKNKTKEKIWSIIGIISFFLLAIIAALIIVKFILTNIFLVGLLVLVGIIFYIATQKADFYSCFQDDNNG